MKRDIKLNPNATLTHVYQRASNGFNVFYSVPDCLVFFTLLSVLSSKHGIKVISLCLMLNHFHLTIKVSSHQALSSFMRELTSKSTYSWNVHYGVSGGLWDRYGLSNKKGEKAARTILAYIGNNPVEGKLVGRAELWQWNFLAYAPVSLNSSVRHSASSPFSRILKPLNPNPFSEKILLASAPYPLRQSVAAVKAQRRCQQPLTYSFLARNFKYLNESQKKQLTDLIVAEYMPIDFSAALSFFGSRERMLTTFAMTTGSEYDLEEEFIRGSDRVYVRLYKRILDLGYSSMADVFVLPADDLVDLSKELFSVSGASAFRVRRFLHILEGETERIT